MLQSSNTEFIKKTNGSRRYSKRICRKKKKRMLLSKALFRRHERAKKKKNKQITSLYKMVVFRDITRYSDTSVYKGRFNTYTGYDNTQWP